MHYEIVDDADGWIVLGEGQRLARFGDQAAALKDVTQRLGKVDASISSSLSIRYRARVA